ncbi:MAG: sterol desaturase family protein [Flavobacteriales bacterium]|nr:sterol desaturase family protein [Flavobacteriales bacterium]
MYSQVLTDPILLVAVPLFVLTFLLEAVFITRNLKKEYNTKDAVASVTMGIGSAFINTGLKIPVFIVFMWIYEHRIFTLPPVWWVFILLFFADDFSFYLHHRACHGIRLFWAAHVNHHSSVNYNLAVALRQSWGELFHKYIWWLWLPLLGFHPLWIFTMMSISLVYQYVLHTELVNKLGPLEWIFNTPSHHRVHHASNVRYLDKNHAGILIIWDRLFGTFKEESEQEKVIYGITSNIHTYNPIEIATHEYKALWNDVKKAPGLINKLRYLIMPPGWSHDGSTKTSKQLQKEAGII